MQSSKRQTRFARAHLALFNNLVHVCIIFTNLLTVN